MGVESPGKGYFLGLPLPRCGRLLGGLPGFLGSVAVLGDVILLRDQNDVMLAQEAL